jgi:hypothetical protein
LEKRGDRTNRGIIATAEVNNCLYSKVARRCVYQRVYAATTLPIDCKRPIIRVGVDPCLFIHEISFSCDVIACEYLIRGAY